MDTLRQTTQCSKTQTSSSSELDPKVSVIPYLYAVYIYNELDD